MAGGVGPLSGLQGKVNANGALVVTLDGGAATATTVTATDAVIIGAATTAGVRLDLESGSLAVREGDDSAYAPIIAGAISTSSSVTGGTVVSTSQTGTSAAGYLYFAGRGQLRSTADGNIRVENTASTNTCDISVADWGTTLSAEAVSVADAAVLAGPATAIGTLTIALGTDNNVGVFVLTNNGAPVEVTDPGNFFSITKDTASSVNVYYESGAYRIQNLRGGSRAMRILLIGG